MTAAPVTYFTTSDRRFFHGTVALVNSLRLTGNEGDIVVFDLGLSGDQRERLATVAEVIEPPKIARAFPKATPRTHQMSGLVCLVDSDMLVTGSLEHVLAAARDGQICVFHDHFSDRDRWFAEWETTFELRAPLRREPYVNAGFIAFSSAAWPNLIERWQDANGLIPSDRTSRPDGDPFRDTEQDALNAILMSEVPREAVAYQPEWAEAYPDAMIRVRIADSVRLRCTIDGRPVSILHQALGPKVWERSGWKRDRRQAYSRLLPRALFADDVPLPLRPEEVPVWVRPTRAGRLASSALIAAQAPALLARRTAKAALPPGVVARVRPAGRRATLG